MTECSNALLIGTGMVADMHAAAIKGTNGAVKLHAVCARRAAEATRFAKAHDIERAFSSLDETGALDNVDFAILTTPPDARLDLIGPLARHGIPVLIEKPVARTLSEAKQVVQTCVAHNLPLGVVLQHRMRPAARALADRLDAGVLGHIASVELRVPWWRDQSYYDTPGRGSFARDGGGVLITQAIHSLDLMLQFCGPVASVQAITTTTELHQLEAEDFAGAVVQFASGAIGTIMASVTHYPGGSEELFLNGTKGSAQLSSNHLRLSSHDGSVEDIGATATTGGGADPMAFSSAWHQAVIEDFADAVRTQRSPAITGHSALAVHALIDAIQTSAKTGQRIDVEHTDG